MNVNIIIKILILLLCRDVLQQKKVRFLKSSELEGADKNIEFNIVKHNNSNSAKTCHLCRRQTGYKLSYFE